MAEMVMVAEMINMAERGKMAEMVLKVQMSKMI